MPKVTRQETKKLANEPLKSITTQGETAEQENTDQIQNNDDATQQLPSKPQFQPLQDEQKLSKAEFRTVAVPQNRMTPLKSAWMELYKPIVEVMKLDMRMNLKRRRMEFKTTNENPDAGELQKAADFAHAFILGFEIRDAMALLRLNDLYIESFEVKDVKILRGEHLSRCIGRMAGTKGKTRFTIENATRTRIVVADTKIHILGSFQSIKVARDAVCGLILGSPPSKVYSRMRNMCAAMNNAY
eukprot:TRINITY_DN2329_c0_g1_i11.p1 TRINITY_DN2329_c0_g1~~TRINITY_DN2329_c0_g1_i11.p1  ORF type:complete len:266 (-),score=41.66 TRINITY_DN2329_c0_g1_i11:226-954(-)